MLATDSHYEEDRLEWMEEGLMNFVFFRYTASTVPGSVDEVAGIVDECSFWPPEFIWYKNSFQEW